MDHRAELSASRDRPVEEVTNSIPIREDHISPLTMDAITTDSMLLVAVVCALEEMARLRGFAVTFDPSFAWPDRLHFLTAILFMDDQNSDT